VARWDNSIDKKRRKKKMIMTSFHVYMIMLKVSQIRVKSFVGSI
jgi:hypothetical protein